ncbi:MAG TPA: MFS transporter [Candidatus Limnocylindrales bacterium]|nr:MFS transporter [Candidatus Limnocylindrales bacterium]
MPEPDARDDWRRIVAIFWLTSLVEGIGVSQVFALLPQLLTTMGVGGSDRLAFVGLFGSLLFVLGMPLVPLWGVWADRYSRKAVIARSAVVEAFVFGGMALAHAPWQVAVVMLCIGFQLGNTGVMLAGIRDVAPRARIGTIIAIFGAAGPIGFAVGPILAGVLVDGAGWSIGGVFGLSALLSLGTAALITFGSREVRPVVIPEGRVLDLAFGAMRGVISDRAVRRIFLVFGTAFLANQMSRPYVPVLVEAIHPPGPGLTSAIGFVAGTAALLGALLAPAAGALGDRIGFRPILVGALVGGGIALGLMPIVAPTGGVAALAVTAVVVATAAATTSSMVFGLLATEVPPERRSQTLNLVYLPLYGAGIVGPAIGALVSSTAGLAAPFLVGGLAFLAGAVGVTRLHPRPAPEIASRI